MTAADIGVSAEIENSALVLSNGVGEARRATLHIAGETAQTITVTQSNKVESKIAVNNSGSIWGGNLGIYAEISQPPLSASNQYEGPAASVDQEGIDEKSIRVETQAPSPPAIYSPLIPRERAPRSPIVRPASSPAMSILPI